MLSSYWLYAQLPSIPSCLAPGKAAEAATAMRSAAKVAVVGNGISGAVCASVLARRGVSVTVFESGRGPGGRMSQRREVTEDGMELFFDHGAPYFTVDDEEVKALVGSWEAQGLVAEWKENFGTFDHMSGKFLDIEKEGSRKKYVGVPGMNSICKALCHETGVEAKYGVTVGKLEWLDESNLWMLSGLDGQSIGHFDGVVASDKSISSPRFTGLTGQSPPLDMCMAPELALKLQHIPVRSCFVLMLAFPEPLSSIPVKGFTVKNSEILSRVFCNSSKPAHFCVPANGECWVLHSTAEYAAGVITKTGLQKPSDDTLAKVADELFQELANTGLNIPRPYFAKAHRWGSAFPAISVGGEDKCLWDKERRLAVCGDFCTSPNVEGAVLSGMKAASKLLENLIPRN